MGTTVDLVHIFPAVTEGGDTEVYDEGLTMNYSNEQHCRPSWRRECETEASSAGEKDKELAGKMAAQHCQEDPADGTGQSG